MKKILFILLAVVLALSVGIIGCTAPAQQEEEEEEEEPEPIIWRADTHLRSGQITALGEPFQTCIDRIYEESDGLLTIEPHWTSELGLDYRDWLKNLQDGLVEMSATAYPSAGSYVPGFAYCSVSFILDPPYTWPQYLDAIQARRQIYGDVCADWDVKPLVHFPYLPDVICGTDILSTVAIYGIEDLDGILMRSTTPEQAALWAEFGCVQTVVDTPEIYTAVKTGMVDAIAWSRDNLLAWNLYEVCPYLIEVFPAKEKYFDFGWAVSEDAWNELSPELQAIVTDAFNEYQETVDWQIDNLGVEWFPPREAELEEAMEEWDMTTIYFSADDQAEVLEAAEGVVVAWLAGTDEIGLSLFESDMQTLGHMDRYNRIMELVEEYAG